MWFDQLGFFALAVYAVAGPAVLARVLYHSGPDRVHLNVSVTGKKVGFLLNNAGAVSALPKGAASLIGSVDVLDIGMHRALGVFRIALEPIKVKEVVFFGEEAGLSVVAALDNVERGSGHYDYDELCIVFLFPYEVVTAMLLSDPGFVRDYRVFNGF